MTGIMNQRRWRDDLPVEEQASADILLSTIDKLGHYGRAFQSVLNLRNHAEEMHKNTVALPPDRRAPGVAEMYWDWMFIAGRDGAMTIFHLVTALGVIEERLNDCPTIAAAIDRVELKNNARKFRRKFRDWEGARHAVGHNADLRSTPQRKRKHSMVGGVSKLVRVSPNVTLIVDGCFVDDLFVSTHNGKEVSYSLSRESLEAIAELVLAVRALFMPIRQYYQAETVPIPGAMPSGGATD